METKEHKHREASLRLSDAGIGTPADGEGILSLEGMSFHAFHGCYQQERREGNDYLVDVHLCCDVRAAAAGDRLEDTVDVQEVYRIVARQMELPRNLIETVASDILEEVCTLKGVRRAQVRLSKCRPPLEGPCRTSSVTLSATGKKTSEE